MYNNNYSFSSHDVHQNLNNIRASYDENGIILIKDFLDQQTHLALLDEISTVESNAEEDLKTFWQRRKVCFHSRDAEKQATIQNDYVGDPYWNESTRKAHVFYENIEGQYAINRIGHGMHLCEQYSVMQKMIYQNPELHTLLAMAGMVHPICHLSVYIPKNPNGVGSEVRPHQESTFAYTSPQSVVVLWVALENAVIENACMWGVLGSNKWPLKFVSSVDHVLKQRTFKKINDVHIPDFLTENDRYTALEVKAGDALLFHGNFIHCSPKNTSNLSRKALSMQFIETHNVEYPNTNWIQQPNNKHLF